MSRAALIDAAFNAGPEIPVPVLSPAQVPQLLQQASSNARQTLVDEAIAELVTMVRSKREKGGGDCFFSAVSMASKNLTGRHYTIAQLRQVLANILTSDDLVNGWEEYRLSEVTDLEISAARQRDDATLRGEKAPASVKQKIYDTAMVLPRRVRAMTLAEYAQYVKTAQHWANEQTLLIFSAYFDVQLVPVTPTPDQSGFTTLPAPRGSDADAFIFLWYSPAMQHYDLIVSQNTAPDEEVTVFTKDTMDTDSYRTTWNDLRRIAVQHVLKSKLHVVQ